MAEKKITDLTLRDDFDGTCNIPVDDSIQTWRVTGAQCLEYFRDQIQNTLKSNYAAKTANYVIDPADEILTMDASGGARTFTLFTAVGYAGKRVTLQKVGGNTNSVQLLTTSSQTIGGKASGAIYLYTIGETIELYSDGANWQIIKWVKDTEWATGGSFNWSTNVTTVVKWRRVADSIELQGHVVASGAVDNATLQLTLPNSWTIDTAKLAGSTATGNTGQCLGSGYCLDGSTGLAYSLVPTYNGSTVLGFVMTYGTGVSAVVNQTVPFTWAANDRLSTSMRVPVTGW